MKRKRSIGLILGFGLALILVGCSDRKPYGEPASDQALNVVATLFPNYNFAKVVGGDHVKVTLLLPPGVEPHSYEPTPRDILTIQQADVFIYTGDAMEPWAADLLAGIDNPKLKVVDLSSGLTPSGDVPEDHDHDSPAGHGDEPERHEHKHAHGGMDPHIWLDLGYARQMVDLIAAAFREKDPGHATAYQEAAAEYKADLAQLDNDIAAAVRNCRRKTIIHGGHFAFGRFARRYGLTHVSPYRGFSPDAEPTPRAIADLIKQLQADDVHYLFHEALVDPRVAGVIAEQTDARLLLLHPAGNVTRDEWRAGETFLSLMRRNLSNLKTGLGYHAPETDTPEGHEHGDH